MKTSRKVFLVATACLVALLLSLILSRRPVLLRLAEPGAIVRPAITIFNPLRDRAPEKVAEQVLSHLRRGSVRAAMARLGGAANVEIAEKEHRHRLRRWKLVDRVDDRDTVTLYYRTDRGLSGQLDSEIIISLRSRAAAWVVRDFLPAY
jgi:hypothetical protein